jgi:hypothetical protein
MNKFNLDEVYRIALEVRKILNLRRINEF